MQLYMTVYHMCWRLLLLESTRTRQLQNTEKYKPRVFIDLRKKAPLTVESFSLLLAQDHAQDTIHNILTRLLQLFSRWNAAFFLCFFCLSTYGHRLLHKKSLYTHLHLVSFPVFLKCCVIGNVLWVYAMNSSATACFWNSVIFFKWYLVALFKN